MNVVDRYERYSQKKGWKFDIVDITESDMKGYKVCIVFISIPLLLCFSAAAKILHVIDRKQVLLFVEPVSTESLSSRVEFTGFRYVSF